MFIINRVDYSNNELVYTPVGYTNDHGICIELNCDYDQNLGAWINQNIGSLTMGYQLEPYNGGINYICRTEVIGPDIQNLPLITNKNQL